VQNIFIEVVVSEIAVLNGSCQFVGQTSKTIGAYGDTAKMPRWHFCAILLKPYVRMLIE
jgi:hypothetical protein